MVHKPLIVPFMGIVNPKYDLQVQLNCSHTHTHTAMVRYFRPRPKPIARPGPATRPRRSSSAYGTDDDGYDPELGGVRPSSAAAKRRSATGGAAYAPGSREAGGGFSFGIATRFNRAERPSHLKLNSRFVRCQNEMNTWALTYSFFPPPHISPCPSLSVCLPCVSAVCVSCVC